MQDRRTGARNRAFSTAQLSWAADGGTVECVMRDLSERGAMILVDEPARLPRDVDLTTVRGGSRPVRVVWRGEGAVGVAFAAPAEPSPAGAGVVSLATARRARQAPSDAERLSARIAAVLRRPDRF